MLALFTNFSWSPSVIYGWIMYRYVGYSNGERYQKRQLTTKLIDVAITVVLHVVTLWKKRKKKKIIRRRLHPLYYEFWAQLLRYFLLQGYVASCRTETKGNHSKVLNRLSSNRSWSALLNRQIPTWIPMWASHSLVEAAVVETVRSVHFISSS